MYQSGIPPLVAGATTFPPQAVAVRRSRKGGGERSEPIRRMLIIPYDTERKSRNADFISIAAERQSASLGPKGPSNLRTLGPKAHQS